MTRHDPSVLAVRDLRVEIPRGGEALRPVDGVSFDLRPGGTLCLAGESGCGKTLTALATLRLLPEGAGRVSGRARLRLRDDRVVDLLDLDVRELEEVRGREVGVVFQEPGAALNPVFRVGDQVAEGIHRHGFVSRAESRSEAVRWLERVQLPDPAGVARRYPHELSGGMLQRVMLALALAPEPRVLVADEPTTALDVTVQAQILELVRDLRDAEGLALLLITHDLSMLSRLGGEVAVVYRGRIVERGPVDRVLAAPAHPYTAGLLACRPRPGSGKGPLPVVPGRVAPRTETTTGCGFAGRCPFVEPRCRVVDPQERPVGSAWSVACDPVADGRVRAGGGAGASS